VYAVDHDLHRDALFVLVVARFCHWGSCWSDLDYASRQGHFYVPVLVRDRGFAAGATTGGAAGIGSKSASMSSAENLTAPAPSSDRIALASAAFCSCIATIFSSTLPAVISL
jgi:hypothetical protein